jgi:GntP family gluconate:H+ symporter
MENVDAVLNDDFTIKSDKKLPNAGLTFAVILVPVVLICLNSFANMSLPSDAGILVISGFVGHPIISLTVGVILALFLDTSRFGKDQLSAWFTKAVDTSGFIFLATGAAGAYGAVLKSSGVGTYLGNLIAETPLPAVFVPFLVALLLSVSNGSATVSLLTGSAIILPLMPALGLHPVIATLAIAAGSSFFYHANASHFWVVCKMNDLEMKEGLALVSVGSAIGSIAGGIAVWVLSIFVTI